MTLDEAIQLLRKRQGTRSLTRFAADIGVSPGYLSNVYSGNEHLGPKLLEVVRLKKRKRVAISYERIA